MHRSYGRRSGYSGKVDSVQAQFSRYIVISSEYSASISDRCIYSTFILPNTQPVHYASASPPVVGGAGDAAFGGPPFGGGGKPPATFGVEGLSISLDIASPSAK
jgi:hypothetical protein